jgi:hypothetical protein
MIVELAIAGAVVAGVGVARAWFARRAKAAQVQKLVASTPKIVRAPGLSPGDVLQVFHEDFALEACTEVIDGDFFARVFEVVSDARTIVQLDRTGEQLFIGKRAEVFEGRVPDMLDTGGRILTLHRRGTTTRGNELEMTGGALASKAISKVDYVLLGDKGGQRLLVLDCKGSRIAVSGELLHLGSVTILPGSS